MNEYIEIDGLTGFRVSTEHPQSSYGLAVLLDPDGTPRGPQQERKMSNQPRYTSSNWRLDPIASAARAGAARREYWRGAVAGACLTVLVGMQVILWVAVLIIMLVK